MTPKCEACPLAGSDARCPAHWHHPGLCHHARSGDPYWRDSILRKAGVEIAQAPGPEPEPPKLVATDSIRPLRSIHEIRAIQILVRDCPHRIRPSCGCPGVSATCTRPDKRGKAVWQDDCESCQRTLMEKDATS